MNYKSKEMGNLLDTIMPIQPRKPDEVIGMLRNIEIIQAQVLTYAQTYWEDEDMRFLLQSEYSNLASCKQAILWAIGWAEELIAERALQQFERTEKKAAYE
jgi:hypothetical protein